MGISIVTDFHTIPVLYENDDLIGVDKPEKLASIPERNREKLSLLKILSEAREQKLYVVHRLDKAVSGVILFAKNAESHRYLNKQFEQRTLQKTYLALVHGTVAGDGGTIDKSLRRFGSGRMGEDPAKGKPCLTEFEVESRFQSYTLVRAFPQTGRKHQLRAHFFSIGHAIVGDTLYGDTSLQKRFPRLMLHALNIRFHLPTGEEIFIESSIPSIFFDLDMSAHTPPIAPEKFI
jgi:RluA family pseudouridine synthase